MNIDLFTEIFLTAYIFRSAEVSLTHLYLSHNKLQNATRDVFGNMPHLQVLDLSHNQLLDLEFDTFKNTKRLQVHSHVQPLTFFFS